MRPAFLYRFRRPGPIVCESRPELTSPPTPTATMHNRQPLTLKLLWRSAKDYDLWPMYLLGIVFGLAGVPISFYLQLSLRESASTPCTDRR